MDVKNESHLSMQMQAFYFERSNRRARIKDEANSGLITLPTELDELNKKIPP